jgi:NAD-dependent deacetylase
MSVWGTEDLMSDDDSGEERKRNFRLTKDTKVSVLSGAGISAESGIPTFRGKDGLWSDESLVRIATPTGFAADPVRGWEFYNQRRANMASAQPNPAHKALAALERAGYDVVVITQNIDRLHQRAGSTRVIELHGSVWDLRCSNPACTLEPFENLDIPIKEIPPLCERCGSFLRPDVVFFEEMLDTEDVEAADQRTKESDLFLVVGTSGVVVPAAFYAQIAHMHGALVIEFNIERTPLSPYCDRTVLGPCGETLPAVLLELSDGAIRV